MSDRLTLDEAATEVLRLVTAHAERVGANTPHATFDILVSVAALAHVTVNELFAATYKKAGSDWTADLPQLN